MSEPGISALSAWSEELNVNVREIGLEDQRLVQMRNRLHDALLERRWKEAQEAIIPEMVD